MLGNILNGALRNWQENSEQKLRQLDNPLNKEERDKYTRYVNIANAIRTMFLRLIVLIDENPQENKKEFRIVELNKIKSTLDKVIERCLS